MKPVITICMLVVASCALAVGGGNAQEAGDSLYRIEEMTVQAGEFTVVGDLYVPLEGARHPAVVWVHGSGGITRQLMVPLMKPQIDAFLKAGFAFFIDDIPGYGASTGEIRSVYQDRALILTKEIEALKARADIIPSQIGVAGASQAGIVMPLATTMTSDIAFMVAEACVAECAYKQEAYLLEQFMICEGLPSKEAAEASRLHLRRWETTDYKQYAAAAESLNKKEPYQLLELNDPVISEAKFKIRDRSAGKLGMFYDPMPLVARMKFPILVLFGEKDKNVNPSQGMAAYRRAFKKAGNSLNRAEWVRNANHAMFEAETGCARELMGQVSSGNVSYSPHALEIITDWLGELDAQFSRAGQSRATSPSS